MKIAKVTKVTMNRTFINKETGKVVKVISSAQNNGRHHVTFQGWNPFPCFSMETSFKVLREWLIDNGWYEMPGITVIIRETESEV